MSILEIFRIIFGSLYVLVLPGLVLSFVFFRLEEKQIDWVERMVISLALSIAIVPLVVFIGNLIGIKINVVSILLEILLIIVVGLGWIFFYRSDYYKFIRNKLKLKSKNK